MRAASLLLALMLAAAPAAAQDLPALFDVHGVAASDVLNVRSAPDAGADIVATLAPGAEGVEIVALSEDGRWGLVNLPETSGWSSMTYLAAQDSPSWTDPSVPLRCLGTEPFWSLAIAGGTATFTTPDTMTPPAAVTERAQAAMTPGILGLGLGNGFAVIRRAECSDGMSGATFGLAIELFLREDAGLAGYSGCCTLR